jgi:VWFA-related protein
MKNAIFVILLSLTALSTVTLAQNIKPAPTPTDNDVVKISTNLIQIDVTVTDKKGAAVKGLTADDFEIYENGVKQNITNFSYFELPSLIENSGENESAKPRTALTLPPVKLRSEQVRRTYALIVDDLGLSFENIFFVRKAIEKFVDEQMQDGDLVAILRVSRGIGALQSFTSDRRLLKAAAGKLRWNSSSRGGIGSFDPIRTSLEEEIDGTKRSDGTVKSVQGINQKAGSQARIGELYEMNTASGTLGAMNYVIRGMSELPGRKSLILFSEGFLTFDRNGFASDGNPLPQISMTAQYLRAVAEQANRSSVIIHTVDPRGLTIPDLMASAADDILPSATSSIRQLAVRDFDQRDQQNSLRYLAEETGGIAYVEQNNINKGIRKILDYQNRGYYLIAYAPDENTFDPEKNRFNKILVKVKRSDLKLQHRSGFFSVTDEKYVPQNQTPQQKLAAALVSPFGASGINIDLYSVFYNDYQNRNFIRSFIYIDPKDLTFALDSDGTYRTQFDVIAMIFDTNGVAASNKIHSQGLKFTKEELAVVRKKGILYNLTIPIIKAGGYQFRIAFQDTASGRIGAASQYIELPDLEKNRLTLSSLVLRSYTLEQWGKPSLGDNSGAKTSEKQILLDTVLRQFRRGSILNYYFMIYNAKTKAGQKPQLEIQTRLYRDGKLLMESAPSPIDVSGQNDPRRIEFFNTITLGTDLIPGEYVLQSIVTDKLAKQKNATAAQSVDFEIVK